MRALPPLGLAAAVLLALAGCRSTPSDAGARAALLDLELVGNETFSDAELEEAAERELALSAGPGVSKAAVDDAAFAVETFYVESGFPEALVEYEYEALGDGRARARFTIEEGIRPQLVAVDVQGATSFDQELIDEFFAEQLDRGILVEGDLVSAARALRSFYLDRGFLRASVDGPLIEIDPPGSAAVARIVVDEGPAFVLREATPSGGLDELATAVEGILSSYVGNPYAARTGMAIRVRVIDLYARRGRPDTEASVTPSYDEETGDVRLALEIDPGEHVTIAAVRVEGNERTRTSVIRRRVALDAGDAYDSEKVQESFSDLYRTALFETVEIELEEETGSERTLVVRVREAPSLELSVEPGWGSYEGPRIEAGLEQRNLFGTGRRFSLQATLSPLHRGARAGLVDPWVLGSDVVGELSLFGRKREEPSFTTRDIGFGLDFRRQWRRHWTTTVGYAYKRSQLEDVEVSDAVPPELLEDADVATISLSVGHDDRNDVFVPTDGGRARAQIEWASAAFGSRLDFVRGNLSLSQALPIGDRSVVAGSFRSGIIVPVAGQGTIPLGERFFNGGESSVRSFAESELGPLDGGEPTGGEAFTVVSLELRHQLHGPLFGAVFVDAGNVTPQYEDYLDFDDFRTGVGVGLRYLLPIGPLRLDLGVNPNPRTGEDDFIVHFSVGLPY